MHLNKGLLAVDSGIKTVSDLAAYVPGVEFDTERTLANWELACNKELR